MAIKDLNRLIDDLKKDPKMVEKFKGAGHDTVAFVSKAKTLGYPIEKKDVDAYVDTRKKEMTSKVKPQSASAATTVVVTVLNGPSPIIYGPAQVVVVVVGPPTNTIGVVSQLIGVT